MKIPDVSINAGGGAKLRSDITSKMIAFCNQSVCWHSATPLHAVTLHGWVAVSLKGFRLANWLKVGSFYSNRLQFSEHFNMTYPPSKMFPNAPLWGPNFIHLWTEWNTWLWQFKTVARCFYTSICEKCCNGEIVPCTLGALWICFIRWFPFGTGVTRNCYLVCHRSEGETRAVLNGSRKVQFWQLGKRPETF